MTTNDEIASPMTERELFAQFLGDSIRDLAWNDEDTVREAMSDPGELGFAEPIAEFVLRALIKVDQPSSEFWEQVDALETVYVKFKSAYEHYEQ